MQGWIKLHRQLLENPLWSSEQFTRAQAWIDLLLLSNHKRTFFYKRNVKVEVLRGQVGRSEVELSDRWKWSRTKVRKFLNDLEKEQQIRLHKTNVTQIVTIIKYDTYQSKEQQAIQQKDSSRTAAGHIQECKEGKELNKREAEFKNEVLSFDYPTQMLQEFIDYWVESNKRKTKLRFEMEKTWDTAKRLKRWSNKSKNEISEQSLPISDHKSNLSLVEVES